MKQNCMKTVGRLKWKKTRALFRPTKIASEMKYETVVVRSMILFQAHVQEPPN